MCKNASSTTLVTDRVTDEGILAVLTVRTVASKRFTSVVGVCDDAESVYLVQWPLRQSQSSTNFVTVVSNVNSPTTTCHRKLHTTKAAGNLDFPLNPKAPRRISIRVDAFASCFRFMSCMQLRSVSHPNSVARCPYLCLVSPVRLGRSDEACNWQTICS